jgi:hypothetical protein
MLLLICRELGCPPHLYALTNVIEALAMHVLITPGKSVGLAQDDFQSLNQIFTKAARKLVKQSAIPACRK